MEKILLSVFFALSLFFLNPLSGFGQCPASVSISAAPGTTICSGTSVTFTATPSGADLSYEWYIGSTIQSESSNIFTSVTLNNSDKIKVVVTSVATGCSTPITTSNTFTMTVNPVLTPSVSISASKTTICPGENVTFTASPVNGGTSPIFQWKIGTAVQISTSNVFSTTTLTDGQSVTVQLTSNATCVSPITATSNSSPITVKRNAEISLTSGAGTNDKILCANTLMTDITFGISNGGTGASVTGLPAGVTGSFNGDVFTISGTPTVSGSFPYIVTTTGNCAQTTATGTITVNPIAAISLTSGAGTNNQTRCINVAISNITFAVSGGGTGAGVTGLPAGVTGTFSGGTFTISGTPTASGSFPYTVTTTGTCTQTTATGTITVNPNAAISLTSGAGTNNQTLCANTLMPNITFAVSGGGTGAGVTGLPTGVTVSFNGGVFTQVSHLFLSST